jgi:hypothetical protein
MSDKVQAEIERARQIVEEAKRRFPQAFTEKPQPLTLCIEYDLIAAMPDFPVEDVLNAWMLYSMLSNDGAYLSCLIDGRPRVNLEGEVVGRVTFKEHAEAVRLRRILERERLGDHQLAAFVQQQRALRRKYFNVIAGGLSEPDVLKPFDNSDEHLTPAARLTLRLVPAVLNYDKASFLDLFNRIAKLMAAYVSSEKGKKRAGSPDLLMTAAVGEIAAFSAGEPLLRDAVVRYLAATVDDDPHTNEPEGGKSLQSQEHSTMASEDNMSEYEDNRAREIIRALSKDGEPDYGQLSIVIRTLSMLLANVSKNMEELLKNISIAKETIDHRAKGWFERRRHESS